MREMKIIALLGLAVLLLGCNSSNQQGTSTGAGNQPAASAQPTAPQQPSAPTYTPPAQAPQVAPNNPPATSPSVAPATGTGQTGDTTASDAGASAASADVTGPPADEVDAGMPSQESPVDTSS